MMENKDLIGGRYLIMFLITMIVLMVFGQKCKAQHIIEFENDTICPHFPADPITLNDKMYFRKQQFDSCYTCYLLYPDKLLIVQPNCRKRKYKCIICGKKVIKIKPDTITILLNENYIKPIKLINLNKDE